MPSSRSHSTSTSTSTSSSRNKRESESERRGGGRNKEAQQQQQEREREREGLGKSKNGTDKEEGKEGEGEEFPELRGVGMNGKGEFELSVEATNKLRASLGLPPLKEGKTKNQEKTEEEERERKEAEKERNTFAVKEKVKNMKRQREYQQQISGKSIAEQVAEEEEEEEESSSVLNWIQKSRTLQSAERQREKELALKRQQLLDQQDEELELSASEIKVKHKLEHITNQDAVILSAADVSVLDDTPELLLENAELAQQERHQRNRERGKKKPIYDASSEEKKAILSQYDEPEEDPSFTLDQAGILDSQRIRELQSVKSKLQLPGELQSLDFEKTAAREYYTQDEMAQFKKPSAKKRRKKLKKKTLELEPLSQDNTTTTSSSSDHGSRKDGGVKRKREEEEEKEKVEKSKKGYEKAMEKAAEENKLLFEDENEDAVLSSTFAKAKQVASQKKEDIKFFETQLEEKTRQLREKKQSVKLSSDEPSVLFSATTEFIRGIQNGQDYSVSKNKTKKLSKEKDSMEVDEDLEEHERMLREQAEKERKMKLKEQQRKKPAQEEKKPTRPSGDEEEVEEVGEETEGKMEYSVGSFLQRLRHQGAVELEESYSGRQNDKKLVLENDPAPNIKLEYVDEFGRQMTPKEAFRTLSYKFHGKKPGKNKQDKRLRRYIEDLTRKKMNSTDTPLSTVQAMQQEQERTATPYILLSGAKGGSEEMERDISDMKEGGLNIKKRRM